MSITNFRVPEKRKNKIEQELDDPRMDELLRQEYLENARALEAEAMAISLNMPESRLEDDAQVILNRMLSMIHEDPELDAIAKAPVGVDMGRRTEPSDTGMEFDTEFGEELEELIRLGRALKESGKTLEDVIGAERAAGADGFGAEGYPVGARQDGMPNTRGIRSHKRRRSARMWAGVAASLCIVCTVSMNGNAMKQFFLERLGWQIGSNPATTINTDGELHFRADRAFSEMEALEVIKNDLGIAPMYFSDFPEEMRYDNLYVDASAQWAKMFYLYNDMVVTVIMDKSDEDMSMAISYDGEKISEQRIELPAFATEAKVEQIQRDETHTAFYAEIEYGNAFYCITGDMEEVVFLELVQNITFG